MPDPPRIIHLNDIDAVPGPGTLTWRPVRMTLGLRAFGCNAYTAARIGDDVVEPHTEDQALAHQELYFVAAGRATFTIDGQSYDAPAGTYVFVPDPASHRHAVAADPDTMVLSFGGPPTFEPSAWEWSFQATPLMRSDPGQAREILTEGLRAYPENVGLHYNLACLEALNGDRERALGALRRAVELNPKAREWAREDRDFASLIDDPAFQALIESSEPPTEASKASNP
jgi:tetratricopeptide (TPR) repeat protein